MGLGWFGKSHMYAVDIMGKYFCSILFRRAERYKNIMYGFVERKSRVVWSIYFYTVMAKIGHGDICRKYAFIWKICVFILLFIENMYIYYTFCIHFGKIYIILYVVRVYMLYRI